MTGSFNRNRFVHFPELSAKPCVELVRWLTVLDNTETVQGFVSATKKVAGTLRLIMIYNRTIGFALL